MEHPDEAPCESPCPKCELPNYKHGLHYCFIPNEDSVMAISLSRGKNIALVLFLMSCIGVSIWSLING